MKKATPHRLLIDEILNSTVPKNEREHAAGREIEQLRSENAELRSENAELRASRSLASARVDALWRTNEQLRAQLAAHAAVCAGGWVKVTERLPKIGDVVDCKNSDGDIMKDVILTPRGWGWESDWHLSGYYFLTDRHAPVEWLDARMPNNHGEAS